MNALSILADLVAIPDLPGHSNAAMSACVQHHLTQAGAQITVLPGPEGNRDNIFATLGPTDQQGYVLSGHMDVVPVEGQVWSSDPFKLTARGGQLFGRGTSDMKGFLACMLATAYAVDEARLKRPLHLAFSYDEEIGCRGVGHMIAKMPELCATPLGCIIGEPSNMVPVLSHKGKHATALRFTGKAAHSSNPDAGVNAIYAAAETALAVRRLNEKLATNGPFDSRFAPAHSTMVAGIMTGGTAVNIIPEACQVQIECRAVPGQNPADLTAQILAIAEACVARGAALSVEIETLSQYPALPPPTDPALRQMMEQLTGKTSVAAVSYGTEAGLFYAAGLPAIICGPGSITAAHRPDEYIDETQISECCAVLRGLQTNCMN